MRPFEGGERQIIEAFTIEKAAACETINRPDFEQNALRAQGIDIEKSSGIAHLD